MNTTHSEYGDFKSLFQKKIFITGHTGFTGSWACIWLRELGADVLGYSLPPESDPNLFFDAKVGEFTKTIYGDIRDFEKLKDAVTTFQPDLILHLAAQPLVRQSYESPRETFDVNTQGTANIVEAARLVSGLQGIVCVTTDKVYRNQEIHKAYVESDVLGGKDPYSASKAAAELIIRAYRHVMWNETIRTAPIAVARGGNIIGGGDWSTDRLVPDFVRSYQSKTKLKLRNADATRPWQHVLDLIAGYFLLLERLLEGSNDNLFAEFNLGPRKNSSVSVLNVVENLKRILPNANVELTTSTLQESKHLEINSDLANRIFGWSPVWNTEKSISVTANWYKDFLDGNQTALQLCQSNILAWRSDSQNQKQDGNS